MDREVTALLWRAAGCPTNTTNTKGEVDSYPCTELCWWCGQPSPGWARPRSCLPGTFPYPLEASVPESPHLCMPCGWTLCDRIALPHTIGVERIRSKAVQGRRQIVSIKGSEPQRVLTLELADGSVGLWSVASRAAAEKPWLDARKALREIPMDVGPCEYLGAVSYDDLDAGPVEKFRSFHHFATRDRWWPCTDSDRMQIREWLLDPPPAPWVGVIGEGKKHHAISAQLLDAVTTRDDLCCVYHLGNVIHYRPAEFARVIAAIEDLVALGAYDDEIASGDYRGRSGVEWLLALRRSEPVIQPWRGGPGLPLALYLRRNSKELKA